MRKESPANPPKYVPNPKQDQAWKASLRGMLKEKQVQPTEDAESRVTKKLQPSVGDPQDEIDEIMDVEKSFGTAGTCLETFSQKFLPVRRGLRV